MARPPRLFAPNLLYHIYARGNNREPIFFEAGTYQRFLNNLERYRQPMEYKLYAYTLLPNHFHLLLQVGTISLSNIMQRLLTAYTAYINKKYDRVGHVLQGRFQSIIVDKEAYLLEVIRYIHLNAPRAGLTKNPRGYHWSSYSRFLYPTDSSSVPIIEIEEVLSLFSSQKEKQRDLFHEFTLAGRESDFDPLREQTRGVLGNSKFQQKLTKVFKGVRP